MADEFAEVTRGGDEVDTPRPRAVPRHAKRSRHNPAGLIVGTVASVLAIVLLAGGAVSAVVWNTFSKRLQGTVELISETDAPPPDIGAIEGGFNILLVGSDSREGNGEAWGGDDGSVLNDVNIVLHVAQDQQSAVAVSFPRDMKIPYPDCALGGDGKINSILYWGGLGCVAQTISEFSGIPIQFAAMITFDGVIAITNAIGGVQVCSTAPIQDPDTGLNLPGGWTTVTGPYALQFLRSRGGVGTGAT